MLRSAAGCGGCAGVQRSTGQCARSGSVCHSNEICRGGDRSTRLFILSTVNPQVLLMVYAYVPPELMEILGMAERPCLTAAQRIGKAAPVFSKEHGIAHTLDSYPTPMESLEVVTKIPVSSSLFTVDLQVHLAEYTDGSPGLTRCQAWRRIRATQPLSGAGESARVQ